MVRISSMRPLTGLSVELVFTDGVVASVDLAPLLRGPVFELVRKDRSLFGAVRVDPALGTIVWPNGADLDPDVLRTVATGDQLPPS
jgi:hypothetical protein